MWLLSKLLQVPKRKDPGENKVLLYSFLHLPLLSSHDWVMNTLPARESVHYSGTFQPSQRYKWTGKYRKTTLSWGFFFFLVSEETTLGVFCFSGLPISKYTKHNHFEQTTLYTMYVYLAKLREKYFRFVKGCLKYFITVSLKYYNIFPFPRIWTSLIFISTNALGSFVFMSFSQSGKYQPSI